MWPLDLALVGLGGLAFYLAAQRMAWDDPRPLYNAWTYAIAIPAALVALDLLLRTVASRFVHRSMQLAFLISVCVHLGLLMLAVNLVLFARLWPEPGAARRAEQAPVRQTIPEHLFHQENTSAEERPEWERPVEASAEQREDAEPQRQRPREELPTESEPTPVEPEVALQPGPAELAPAPPSADADPVPADRASELQRQDAAARPHTDARVREVPDAPTEATDPDTPELAEADLPRAAPRVTVAPEAPEVDAAPPVRSAPRAGAPVPRRDAAYEAPQVAAAQPRRPDARRAAAAPPVAGPRVAVPESPAEGGAPAGAAADPELAARAAPEATRQATPGAEMALPDSLAEAPTSDRAGMADRPPLSRAGGGGDSPRVAALDRRAPGGVRGRSDRLRAPESLEATVPQVGTPQEGSEAGEATSDAPPERQAARRRQGPGEGPEPAPGPNPQSLPIDAPLGASGLARAPAPEAGRPRPVDRPDPTAVRPERERFRRQPLGTLAPPTADTSVATESFRQRLMRTAGGAAPHPNGLVGPETEEAIERGLAYLAAQQQADGSWSLQAVDPDAILQSDTAATGLCILAFQGAGYTHRQHQYASTVARGIESLVDHQKGTGDLFRREDATSNQNVWLYSHSIAALALCEAYGMTQDPKLREPAQKSIDFIAASQHPSQGGWRYQPRVSSDTSVTGWMMMALKSGELAGLEVPEKTYAGIERWLELAQAARDRPYLFRYNPYAPDTPTQRHGREVTPTMTAVGLLMRMYGGWRRDHPNLQRGARYLLGALPANGTPEAPRRDTYYWYYATQVMFHMGGDYWKRWNDALHPLLIDSQVRDGPEAGSWDPRSPVEDRWSPHAGRLYVTAMNLLNLEVFYRHLPIYKETAE